MQVQLPEQLIVEFGWEMERFWKLLDEPDLPTLNPSDTFFQLVEEIRILNEADDHLANAAFHMGAARWLFDPDVVSEEQQEVVVDAIARLGRAIQNKLLALHAYRDGVFDYEFEEFFDDRTVVFRRRPPGSTTASAGANGGPLRALSQSTR